jgi:2-polyprenyl-6-methoxyphenol hydroxylase-like FAD-dependent oxidoreductase
MGSTTTDVVVVGAGPVGLLLAGELRRAGARPLVLDRRAGPSDAPKANGVGGLVVRMLDHRGLLDRMAAHSAFAGRVPGFPFGPVPLRFPPGAPSPLEVVGIAQPRMERVLETWAGELGVRVERSHEVRGLVADADGVDLEVRGPDGDRHVRARYVVGCDGARSAVRSLAGIGFPGETDGEVLRLGHFRLAEGTGVFEHPHVEVPGYGPLRPGWNRTGRGRVLVTSLQPGVVIVGVREAGEPPSGPLELPEFQASLHRVLDADLPLGEPTWLSWTVSQARLAEHHRLGRVLLAGDAAHLFPAGGASLNVGLADAVNLGWKLAAVLSGDVPDGVLDSYQAERRPAAERALMHTRVQAALERAEGPEAQAQVALLTELAALPEAARHLGELLSGADVSYGVPGVQPLVGRFVPDLDLVTDAGPTTVAEVLRPGGAVLLDLAGDPRLRAAAEGWAGRVRVVRASCTEPPAPALLVRPDGYVAWAGGASPADALATWFGPALGPPPVPVGGPGDLRCDG